MTITTYYECRKCGHEIECEVEIGEGTDLPNCCPECKEPIPDSAHAEMEEDAYGRGCDIAKDMWD